VRILTFSPSIWKVIVISQLYCNLSVIIKGSDCELGGDVSGGVAGSLEMFPRFSIGNCQESIRGPSILVDAVNNHCLIVQLGKPGTNMANGKI